MASRGELRVSLLWGADDFFELANSPLRAADGLFVFLPAPLPPAPAPSPGAGAFFAVAALPLWGVDGFIVLADLPALLPPTPATAPGVGFFFFAELSALSPPAPAPATGAGAFFARRLVFAGREWFPRARRFAGASPTR